MKKQKMVSVLISAGAVIVTLVLWVMGLLQGLENKSLDSRFMMRGPIKPSPDIAIVCADEESIKQLGRWPWARSVHADLVSRLTRAGAKVITFDVLFTEPDREHASADKYFGQVIRKSGNVVLGSFFEKVTSEGVPTGLTLPTKPALAGVRTGFVNCYTETDGIIRKIMLTVENEGTMVPSLALSSLSLFLGKEPLDIISAKKIPLNEYNEMSINFFGGYEIFPYYPYYKVVSGEIPGDKFKGKIVLVGGTATALFDQKAIPFSQVFPGVEIHANVMSNILLDNYLRPWSSLVTFLFIVGFALLAGLLLGKFSPLKGGMAAVGMFLGYFALVYYLFAKMNIYGEFVAPALSLSLSYGATLFYRFMTEEREKRWIKKTFSHYLSAHVMESILSNPDSLRLGGQRANLTVLFSDIRGFTTISEALNPEEVVELLNEYLSKMVEVVFKYDGTLDKFIGDAVMAFWGAPVAQGDHSKRGVLCAIEMIEELEKLQGKWRAEGKKVIEIGIGVNTGEMVVGNMGSKDKMEYTIIGDNVNLGSRLEGLNKEYKTHIIISESTYRQVKDIIEAEPLGAVKVKGKEKPVDIYTVTGRKGAPRAIGAVERKAAAEVPEKKKPAGKKPFDPDARVEMHKNP